VEHGTADVVAADTHVLTLLGSAKSTVVDRVAVTRVACTHEEVVTIIGEGVEVLVVRGSDDVVSAVEEEDTLDLEGVTVNDGHRTSVVVEDVEILMIVRERRSTGAQWEIVLTTIDFNPLELQATGTTLSPV